MKYGITGISVILFLCCVQCAEVSHKPAGLYADEEALEFRSGINEIDFPTTINKACETLGIQRSRLRHSRIFKSQGVFGSRWAQLSPGYFIGFYFATSQPDDPAQSTERIHRVIIAPDLKKGQ